MAARTGAGPGPIRTAYPERPGLDGGVRPASTKPDVSLLSEEFLAEVRGMQRRNLAVELLQKLLSAELATRRRKNVVQARSFAEMLEADPDRDVWPETPVHRDSCHKLANVVAGSAVVTHIGAPKSTPLRRLRSTPIYRLSQRLLNVKGRPHHSRDVRPARQPKQKCLPVLRRELLRQIRYRQRKY